MILKGADPWPTRAIGSLAAGRFFGQAGRIEEHSIPLRSLRSSLARHSSKSDGGCFQPRLIRCGGKKVPAKPVKFCKKRDSRQS